MSDKSCTVKAYIFAATLLCLPLSQAYAAGMVPASTLLVIEESHNGGTINVKNSDTVPMLLYTTIEDVKDDSGITVNVTQPVVRVEPGQEQQVRFIMESSAPLTKEHYKRVTFEGIPPSGVSKGAMKVNFNLRQDLPVLIRPKNLPVVTDAWKLLKWSGSGQHIKVSNPSAYVVRLAQQVIFLPSQTAGEIAKNLYFTRRSSGCNRQEIHHFRSICTLLPGQPLRHRHTQFHCAVNTIINKKRGQSKCI